jgi:hypothetical protein
MESNPSRREILAGAAVAAASAALPASRAPFEPTLAWWDQAEIDAMDQVWGLGATSLSPWGKYPEGSLEASEYFVDQMLSVNPRARRT